MKMNTFFSIRFVRWGQVTARCNSTCSSPHDAYNWLNVTQFRTTDKDETWIIPHHRIVLSQSQPPGILVSVWQRSSQLSISSSPSPHCYSPDSPGTASSLWLSPLSYLLLLSASPTPIRQNMRRMCYNKYWKMCIDLLHNMSIRNTYNSVSLTEWLLFSRHDQRVCYDWWKNPTRRKVSILGLINCENLFNMHKMVHTLASISISRSRLCICSIVCSHCLISSCLSEWAALNSSAALSNSICNHIGGIISYAKSDPIV